MVKVLLECGAYPDEGDDSGNTASHMAVEMNLNNILTVLLEYGANPSVKGDGGYSPLHTAATVDADVCATTLLDHNANPLVKSNGGSYPIHVAARLGALNTLKVLLTQGPEKGFPLNILLNVRDREQQPPLHSAVNGGSNEAVALLMRHGASLLSKQADGTTAVHRAAIQGNLRLLTTMTLIDANMVKRGLDTHDLVKRTPLHWATVFDHVESVEYLLSLGADVNCQDKHGMTPLLIATSCGCWKSMKIILSKKQTNVEECDTNGRNFLHMAVLRGIDMKEYLACFLLVRNIRDHVNQKDFKSMTPLHYAAKAGALDCIQGLVTLGAEISVKNDSRQTPFHVAAQSGNSNVCAFFLDSPHGTALKNEMDIQGRSPLHLAAEAGHLQIVDMLLHRGGMVIRDHHDNTALHLAAAMGRTYCANALISVHNQLLDVVNLDGDTALHLAGRNGHESTVKLLLSVGATILYNDSGLCFFDDPVTMGRTGVCHTILEHPRWEECMKFHSVVHGQLIMGLIKFIPSACLVVLDRCVQYTGDSFHKDDYHITYNFRYMHLGESYKIFAKEKKLPYSPLLPLEMMQTNKRGALLSHPLTLAYLKMKWREYGIFFNLLDLSIYLLYLVSLTLLITAGESLNHYHPIVNTSWTMPAIGIISRDSKTPTTSPCQFSYKEHNSVFVIGKDTAMFKLSDPWFPPETKRPEGYKNSRELILVAIISTFCIFHILNQAYQIVVAGRHWFASFEISYFVELGTYASSLFFVIPFWFGFNAHVQVGAGAVATFLAWFNCLVYFQRFDSIGIYIVMYLQIMKTMWKIGIVFAVLVVAFGLTFHILLPSEDTRAFETPWLSIYRTFILMFEIDYIITMNTPYHDGVSDTMHFVALTYFFIFMFLLCMPILLINLLIGLAVGDIASVLKDASEKKLATQIHFYAHLEKRLPFLSRWTIDEFQFFTKKKAGYTLNEIYWRLSGLTQVDVTEIKKIAMKEKRDQTSLKDVYTLAKQNQAILAKVLSSLNIALPPEVINQGSFPDQISQGLMARTVIDEENILTKSRSKDAKNRRASNVPMSTASSRRAANVKVSAAKISRDIKSKSKAIMSHIKLT